jgi:hypothetical protein
LTTRTKAANSYARERAHESALATKTTVERARTNASTKHHDAGDETRERAHLSGRRHRTSSRCAGPTAARLERAYAKRNDAFSFF